ncbi:MAG: hypothetical protein ACRDJM_01850 [Actinomycetota bacterium]
MQPREGIRNPNDASRPHPDSLDSSVDHREIDLKMVEALARIERVRSKALAALGSMISTG